MSKKIKKQSRLKFECLSRTYLILAGLVITDYVKVGQIHGTISRKGKFNKVNRILQRFL